jgi:formylglycine-generating enzyme required for sulfatase activity
VLPPGFSPHPDAQEHPSGWPSRIVGEQDGMTMVLVPGGTYLLGRDSGTPIEGPAHRVELPSFYIDEHEVTVGQFASYREAMTRRGEAALPSPEELTRLGLTDRHPVVLTSAKEALRYAEWAGKSLPTEAQWESAARGPEGLIRPWGPGATPWADRRPRQLDPVMSFPGDRSPAGAFDMAANAWEWTVDWFSGDTYASRAGRIPFNPGGPATPSSTPARQTVRGSSPQHETTYREGMRVDTRLPYLGFRCALNVEGLPLPGDPPRPGAIPIPSSNPSRPPAATPPPPPPPARPRGGSGTLVPF